MQGQLLEPLAARRAAGKPLRVGLIGAGTFGWMFLSQTRRAAGLHLLGIAHGEGSLTRGDSPGYPASETRAPAPAGAGVGGGGGAPPRVR
jgi:hypothetical protein